MKAADSNQTYLATLKSLLKGDSKVDTNFSIEKDLLLYKNRWYIPKDEGLRRTIMEAEHDSNIAGHFGTYKTIGRVRANFYWPRWMKILPSTFALVMYVNVIKLSGKRSLDS